LSMGKNFHVAADTYRENINTCHFGPESNAGTSVEVGGKKKRGRVDGKRKPVASKLKEKRESHDKGR